jgi:lactoylglutathione lyase
MFTQIGLIMITVSNMERSTAFYKDVLGLNLQFASPDWTQFDIGGVKLALHIAGSNLKVNSETGIRFAFYVDDIEKTLAGLTSRGATVMQRREEDFGTLVDINDPDGYVVQFCQLKQGY